MSNLSKLDELAISMPHEAFPEVTLSEHIEEIAKVLNIKIDFDNILSAIEFNLKLQAYIRYEYAKNMLKYSNDFEEFES